MTNGDVVLLAPTATSLIDGVLRSLAENGQSVEVSEIVVGNTKLIKILVTTKRVGEGQIAADMKARKGAK